MVYKSIFAGWWNSSAQGAKIPNVGNENFQRRFSIFPTLEIWFSNVGFRFFLPGFEVASYLDGNISAERDISDGMSVNLGPQSSIRQRGLSSRL